MWKIALLTLALTGCGSTQAIVSTESTVYHPPMPAPYNSCPVYWEVHEVADRPKVALSYDDNVTAAICSKNMERYLLQLLNTTCHYRQELEEEVCIVNTK